MKDFSVISEASRPPVGVPIHEIALHEALGRQSGRLFSPGVGRSAFVIREPELGFGRPDAVILTLSSSALSAFRSGGLRLPSLNAAKSLAGAGSSLTDKHARALARDLERIGWTPGNLGRAADMVADSVAVEAKLSEWRRAIRQAAGYRVGAGRAAILLPARVAALVDARNLESHGIGLLAEDGGSIRWSMPAPSLETSISHRAWLVELLLRGLESGTAHRAT